MPRSDYTLKTLRKGLEVLETLADDRDALTLTALAARLQESPPVVFRILRTLEERGYVEQDAGSKRWQPGFRAWEIGCRVVNRTGLVEAARPLLKAQIGRASCRKGCKFAGSGNTMNNQGTKRGST